MAFWRGTVGAAWRFRVGRDHRLQLELGIKAGAGNRLVQMRSQLIHLAGSYIVPCDHLEGVP